MDEKRYNPAVMETRMPERIKALPVGPNGFPVPWFVAWVGGKPEFRASDHRKLVLAVNEKRCWTCGNRLGSLFTFVVGPMCGVNRTSAEPPSHTDCARFSAVACPFLSRPQADRREGGLDKLGTECPAGHMIRRNPGVTLLWTTRSYSTFDDGRGGVLFRFGDPKSVEWYREGRAATREEVKESVRTGLPALEEIARTEDGALEELHKMHEAFTAFYPVDAEAFGIKVSTPEWRGFPPGSLK